MTADRYRASAEAALAVAALGVSGCAESSSQPTVTAASAPSPATASGAVLQLRAGDRPAELAGRWTSAVDPAESVTFNPDGTTSRDYTGVPPRSGTWAIVGRDDAPDLPPSTAPDTTILEIVDDADRLSVRYVLLSVTEQELTLSHVPRGNTLHYVR